jgi:hypothetical protein
MSGVYSYHATVPDEKLLPTFYGHSMVAFTLMAIGDFTCFRVRSVLSRLTERVSGTREESQV